MEILGIELNLGSIFAILGAAGIAVAWALKSKKADKSDEE